MSELIKNIIISNSIFSQNTSHTTINGFFPALRGLANKINATDSLKSSLGEFSERYTELLYKKDTEKVAAYNIMSKRSFFIDPSKVYLLRKDKKKIDPNDFFDSSGTAYFTNSDKAVEKAFFEFIERQSLVHSFIRKWAGKKVNANLVGSNLRLYSNCNFATVMMNDISILDGVYVILFVGIDSNSYNVGLGTDYNLVEAVKKALAEGIGFKKFCISDKEITHRGKFLQHIDTFLMKNFSFISSYDSIFFDYLTPGFIFERFKYLQNTKIILKETKLMQGNTYNSIPRIKKLCRGWKLEPYISFLNSELNNVKGDVIHISAQGAYPHIFTSFLDPEEYKSSYVISNTADFPNKYKYLPFP
ncbi:MAG: YcaO-like family protein [Lactobacillus sp.]|uniref:YcaO-like family protein n=1 Tax=Lactobacillus johnsonii TaxID=33959 RepID=UPI0021A39554|nr:YcaO-like family protein [Lactobacillus johnsonii]MDE7055864.1 YcaO-like family protein [Lactobacillus sp.]